MFESIQPSAMMPQRGALWQIRLRGGWADVGPEDEAFIESAWLNKELSVSYTARRQRYEVDFQRMFQRDSHGRERPLRRVTNAAGTDDATQDCSMEPNPDMVAASDIAEQESAQRIEVRECTAQKALSRLGILSSTFRGAELQLSSATPDAALRADLCHVKHFRDGSDTVQRRSEDPKALLPRFEVLACPCCMEFGNDWAPLDSHSLPGRFWVHHVAALNIGESGNAADFAAYRSDSGSLNDEAYLQDMRRVFGNLFEAQSRSGVTHSILIPIGMGAFLRYLAKNDPMYQIPECMARLRQRIAEAMADAARPYAVRSEKPLRLHVCVQGGADGSEAATNNASLRLAFQSRGLSGTQVIIHEDKDATSLATELAMFWCRENPTVSSAPAVAPVSLANAANARLLGNHWFGGGALRAIDENLHRRASSLAALSLLLNAGTSARFRQPDELAQRVIELGGDVEMLSSCRVVSM